MSKIPQPRLESSLPQNTNRMKMIQLFLPLMQTIFQSSTIFAVIDHFIKRITQPLCSYPSPQYIILHPPHQQLSDRCLCQKVEQTRSSLQSALIGLCRYAPPPQSAVSIYWKSERDDASLQSNQLQISCNKNSNNPQAIESTNLASHIIPYGLKDTLIHRDQHNKIMNLFPLINRSKKSQTFSNPLNGLLFYSDNLIQSTPKQPFSTISYNDTPHTFRLRSQAPSSLKTKSNYKLQAHSQASQQRPSLTPLKTASISKHYTFFEQPTNKSALGSPAGQSNTFIFPDVEIVPLHLIEKYEDISRFTIHMKLEKYFRLYFSGDLRYNSRRLNQKLEMFLPLLKKYDILDKEIQRKKWPKEFWEIKKTEELLSFIEKYEKPSEYWVRYVLILIQLYCVPHPNIRKTSLQNLLLLLHQHFQHQLEVPIPTEPFTLLLENGVEVTDLIDIPFSAKRLYLTKKRDNPSQTTQSFTKYQNLIKNYRQQCKKRGFIGRLRKHFRKQIVPNKCDEDTINYDIDFPSKEKQRKSSLQKAMKILQKKNLQSSKKILMTLPSPRPKSREEIWKQENIQTSQNIAIPLKYIFHVDIGGKSLEQIVINQFERYRQLILNQSKQSGKDLGSQQIYLYVLQRNHPVWKALMNTPFQARKVKNILEIITNQKLPDDRFLAKTLLGWREFLQLWVLTSPKLRKLVKIEDCFQLVRNFVENYMEMREQEYYRDELASKICSILDADGQTLSTLEQLIWSWMDSNGFIQLGIVQKQLLWTYEERSKTFYLLIISMIFATFTTSPLDLAYDLLQ